MNTYLAFIRSFIHSCPTHHPSSRARPPNSRQDKENNQQPSDCFGQCRSFLQILVTTRGSNALGQAAMQGCLGSDNILESLNEMRVRYGELVSASTGAERKGQNEKGGGKCGRVARFGVPEEVRPLVPGETYGGW